jgi:hypothetical protein
MVALWWCCYPVLKRTWCQGRERRKMGNIRTFDHTFRCLSIIPSPSLDLQRKEIVKFLGVVIDFTHCKNHLKDIIPTKWITIRDN